MTTPAFLDPEVDHSDDESGYTWDCDYQYDDLGNYEGDDDGDE